MPKPPFDPPLLGTHISIAGGVENAITRAQDIGATAMQIFTRNASRWQVPPLADESTAAFLAAKAAGNIRYMAAHASYLINLASPDQTLQLRSLDTLLDEIYRCRQLQLDALVIHPGAHMGKGTAAGIAAVAQALRSVCHESDDQVMILLENTAGQGTGLGSTIEELAEIIELVADQRLALCLDTCHAFAAGYDVGTAEGYAQLIARIEVLIGLDKLLLFHLNDSKKPLGSRVDRHEHVGQGEIGVGGFRCLMQDRRFFDRAKIIETPPGNGHCFDLENLALLRSLAEQQTGG